MSVLIVIPTILGREKHLDNTLEAYKSTCPGSEFFIITGRNTCGEVWNLGAECAAKNFFDYVHMTADDMIPHKGWYECATETVKAGYIPSALIFNPDGTVQSHGVWATRYKDWTVVPQTLIPFSRPEQWIAIPNIHYYSDNAASSGFKSQGLEIVARTNYAFTHHFAQPGRKDMTDAERQIWKNWEAQL